MARDFVLSSERVGCKFLPVSHECLLPIPRVLESLEIVRPSSFPGPCVVVDVLGECVIACASVPAAVARAERGAAVRRTRCVVIEKLGDTYRIAHQTRDPEGGLWDGCATSEQADAAVALCLSRASNFASMFSS